MNEQREMLEEDAHRVKDATEKNVFTLKKHNESLVAENRKLFEKLHSSEGNWL